MKIKATKTYRDTHENRLIASGEVYDTAEDRAKLIVSKGYAVKVEETKETKVEETESPKKRRK